MFSEGQIKRVSQAVAIISLFFYGRVLDTLATWWPMVSNFRFDEAVAGAVAVLIVAYMERKYGRPSSEETGK